MADKTQTFRPIPERVAADIATAAVAIFASDEIPANGKYSAIAAATLEILKGSEPDPEPTLTPTADYIGELFQSDDDEPEDKCGICGDPQGDGGARDLCWVCARDQYA